MGLLKSGFMQPVEDTTPIEESETLISDIPDDAFGHVLFWLPPLTNLAAARVAKQWRVRVAKYFERLRELDVTTEEMSASLVRGASGPERWGRKSSRLAMLLGKCRSLESLTVGFKDTGQFKGILKAIIHDVDELVYDEDAGGDVPLQFTIQRDFSKNEKRPLRWCDKEEELDLPPY